MTSSNTHIRDQLMAEYLATKLQLQAIGAGREKASPAKLTELQKRANKIKNIYFDGLPCNVLSSCPFCESPYRSKFDEWGLDGLWWQYSELTVELNEPAPCEHYVLIRGSVNLNGKPFVAGFNSSRIGPDVPYVVEKIIQMPTMKAVIGQIDMACGFTAYPIVYFATEKPASGTTMENWREKSYNWLGHDGNSYWSTPQYPWDFELAPWVDCHKIGWVDLEQPASAAKFGTGENCPFINLPGQRLQQTIYEGQMSAVSPPNNEEYSPFE